MIVGFDSALGYAEQPGDFGMRPFLVIMEDKNHPLPWREFGDGGIDLAFHFLVEDTSGGVACPDRLGGVLKRDQL